MLKITVLGCGSSGGVPFVGCSCPVCTSTNPKNKRTRVSILLESETTSILIDTSPDLRSQCLQNGISRADNIIFTHAHADHVHGIDDVRSFNFAKNAPIDIYADGETIQLLNDRFAYVFRPVMPEWGWYRPCLVPNTIEPYKTFRVGDIEVLPIEQKHGKGRSIGLRFGNFAYCTDTNGLPEASLKALEGIDTWIVDCLRYDEAPTHSHLAMTLGWIDRIKPKRAYLTHMNHSFDYDKLLSELPKGIEPAYDGLRLEV